MLKFFACATLLCDFSLGGENSAENSDENSAENSDLRVICNFTSTESFVVEVEVGSTLDIVVTEDAFQTFDDEFQLQNSMSESLLFLCYQSGTPQDSLQTLACPDVPVSFGSPYVISDESSSNPVCTTQGEFNFDNGFYEVQYPLVLDPEDVSHVVLEVILCFSFVDDFTNVQPLGKVEFQLEYPSASPSYSASPTPGAPHSLLPFEFDFPDDATIDVKSFLVNVCQAVQDTFTDNGAKSHQAVDLHCVLEKQTFNPTTAGPTASPTASPPTTAGPTAGPTAAPSVAGP